MMTVDWTKWMTATPEEQQELWRRYREIVKQESEEAKAAWRRERAEKAARA